MSNRKPERKGLGRGLSALMADIGLDAENAVSTDDTSAQASGGLSMIPMDQITANLDQPRKTFAEQALEELAQSIRERGIVQPIVVRPWDGGYQIVAGERRWRASQRAGLDSIPAVVRELSDQEVLEVAILENIQREGLNAIEEASGYKQLIDRFGHTQDRIASALGKSRSHIANLLRLLSLPEPVQDMVRDGLISAGHARALVTADDPRALASRVLQQGLSVRQTEALAKETKDGAGGPTSSRKSEQKDADTRVLEDDLSANLGMAVIINHRSTGEGSVTIRYQDLEQLDQLCQLLSQVR